MTLLGVLSFICFGIGASFFMCGIVLILRIGYKYIMYELYGDRDYRNGPYIRNIIFNITIVLMTFALLFFAIGALTYTAEDHNDNKQQKINYCNKK